MGFKRTNIPYEETGFFSKVFIDYLEGDSKLKSFYEYPPTLSAFADALKKMGNYEYPRKLLSTTLKEYYTKNASGATSEATLKNIQKLEDKNCFTVTTGQQLCLFTGPLYFVFKIITAISLAEKLNKEYPANHFVPVFWMASEDHDFAEINHAKLFGKKIEWNAENMGGPVGRMPLTSLSSTLEDLYTLVHDEDLRKLISQSYSSEKTLGQATFSFVNALFGKYGLVIVEPDNANLKQVFSPVVTDEVLNGTSYKLVSDTDKKLADIGIEPQVHAREINLFYMDEHGRNRIEKKADKFEVLNTGKTFTANEITEAVKQSPGNFSPNALLRPVYQQSILPSAAYIGGPAEVAYWLQLKSIFDHYKIPFPILMSRNCALIMDKTAVQKINKLNISVKDIFKDTESLVKELLKRVDGVPDFEKESAELKDLYTSIGKQVGGIDPTLVASTQAELQKQFNALKTLKTKLMRVRKQQEETSISRIRKVKETLFPNGALQERTENFIPFYLEYGASLFDMLKENFDPFDFSMQILSEIEE